MDILLQRSLVPLALITTLMIALHRSLPELRTPAASVLLGVTALLLLLRPIERKMRMSSQFRTRVLVIGGGTIAQKFIDEIERFPKLGYSIVGLVAESASGSMQRSPYLVLGTIDELRTIVAAVKPNVIVLALSDRRGRMPGADLLEFQSNGIVVEDVADSYERVSGKLPIEVVTPGQLIASQRFLKSRALKIAQRVLAFAAALVLLVLSAPLLALIAVAIKLDSGGPILFRQTRLGKRSRPFQLIKFRTMKPAVDRPPSEWVQDNTERITRVGSWLRRLRLDELPQLVNVVLGQMNLVGPRPHPVSNLQLFRESIPYYTLRGSILPGITGWAQVRYHYANNLEEETEKMRYDLYYIKHMSLWMDFNILFDTFSVFLAGLKSTEQAEVPSPQKPLFPSGPRLHVRRLPEPAGAVALSHSLHLNEPETRTGIQAQ
jgi:exopolysaccharide biosynthesis polyprenyl glycosylphosphotransferase